MPITRRDALDPDTAFADDFAYRGNGTSSHKGQVLNPYDPIGTRTHGGSSAGSAVAVAVAGALAFAALGTDGVGELVAL